MKKLFFIITIVFYSISSSGASLSECSQTVQTVYQYNRSFPANAANIFPYPWQDINWLEQVLGEPQENLQVTEKKLIWSHYAYSVITRDDVIISSEGLKPRLLAKNKNKKIVAASQLIHLLGQPDKIEENKMFRSTWKCGKTGSSISLLVTTDDQRIQGYQGIYCPKTSKKSCKQFSRFQLSFPSYKNIGLGLQRAELYIQHSPFHPQLTEEKAIRESQKQTMQLIASQLGSPVQHFSQLSLIAKRSLENYYTKLRQCAPGTYRYTQPFILGGRLLSDTDVAPFFYVASSTIQGMHEDKCVVETKAAVGKNDGLLVCQFSANNLNLFTPTKADIDSIASNLLSSNQKAKSNQWLRECQVYMNGKLLSYL